jgi:hypothetical protein
MDVTGSEPKKMSTGLASVDAESALSANHTASRKAGFTRAESK